MVIYQLQGNEYVECQFSPTFPYVSGATLWQFLQLAETEDDNGVIRALRQWLKTQVQRIPMPREEINCDRLSG